MPDYQIRQVVLSTENLDEPIQFYESLGFSLKFRDGGHYAALDGGSVTIALTTPAGHPAPGRAVIGVRAGDVGSAAKAVEQAGGAILTAPYDDAHERRATVYDNQGNCLVCYQPLGR